MNIKPFKLERYFARYEFSARYLLSSSDCDGLLQSDLVKMADDETRFLWDNLALGYTESLGHPMLRQEISKLYHGISADDCQTIVPEEGIYIALNSILQKGDHVICTFPGYQSLYEIAESLGCEVTKWEPEEENGWRFNPDFLEQNIKTKTKLVVVNFPHNPTGYLPSKEDFQKILDLARKNDLYLFSDEMYRFLEYSKDDRLPSACEVYDKAISLFGMSKTFGMAGARIGWLITKDKRLYSRMATFKDYTTICSNAPGEILSIIALRAKEEIIAGHLTRIDRNLGLLDSFFDEFEDRFEWIKPKAGTIGFPRIKGGINAFDFCQQVVNEANIMLLPSTVYDYDDRHLRLGFGRENMPEALQKLCEYLRK
ncbi:MAG: aminotransferase class I/II-fold pyridoxal phosphate-dependent enzyme [Chloroflexi bacterium]|nr:aminotransferase class I/II-fold pyridoxal phosphate-dependent enzyme [Chloroflexota bacterium]